MKETEVAQITQQERQRYIYLRDNGHLDYVKKSRRCDEFFKGEQWSSEDMARLRAQRRPWLTINKILPTVASVLGEQIYQRTEIGFLPRSATATQEVADALTKVVMQISDNNELPWIRSEVFADGVITSRGFYDVRVSFEDSLRGEVVISLLNPRNVLIDGEADDYDPDSWNDVIVTKWLTADDISLLYGADKAKEVRTVTAPQFPYGYDDLDLDMDRFGYFYNRYAEYSEADMDTIKNIRVIERQFKKLDTVEHFVDIELGDMRMIPTDWDRERISAFLEGNRNISVIKKRIKRIRWRVTAEDVLLHDEWSPYAHYTVVPYFPYFRRGSTIGIVENLISPQESLNKTRSQELHVVNTSANSGWITRAGGLANMTSQELEQIGAKTGLVIEVTQDVNADIKKIDPNQTPQGLDRLSYKSGEDIKEISGVSDYMQGFAREDVAAKALKANQERGQANLAKVMDNLNRTDTYLGRMILHCVQTFYTEPRLIHITGNTMLRTTDSLQVNQPTPEGTILNDLTLGEYRVIVTAQPERDTYEDSMFEQAVALRTEVGIPIPDETIIMASRLRDKMKIVESINAAKQSPEAQQQAQLALQQQEAEIQKIQAEAQAKAADAALKQKDAGTAPDAEMMMEMRKAEMELQMEERKMRMELELKRQELEATLQFKREELQAKLAMQQQEMTAKLQMQEEQNMMDMELKRRQMEQQSSIQQQKISTDANLKQQQIAAKGAEK